MRHDWVTGAAYLQDPRHCPSHDPDSFMDHNVQHGAGKRRPVPHITQCSDVPHITQCCDGQHCLWETNCHAVRCALQDAAQQKTEVRCMRSQDKFMPYFQEAGHDVTAVSLRGQGRSEIAAGQKDGGTIKSHADDLAEIISGMDRKPILISHSLGGLVAQRCPLVITCLCWL